METFLSFQRVLPRLVSELPVKLNIGRPVRKEKKLVCNSTSTSTSTSAPPLDPWPDTSQKSVQLSASPGLASARPLIGLQMMQT